MSVSLNKQPDAKHLYITIGDEKPPNIAHDQSKKHSETNKPALPPFEELKKELNASRAISKVNPITPANSIFRKTSIVQPFPSYNPFPGGSYHEPGLGPGKCGLRNMGNTCYFNSGIQCIMHSMPLVRFLLGNKWKQDINYRNPLGMKGKLIMAFADLTRRMWRGSERVIAPTDLKQVTGEFAQQFAGWGQQDPHELILFMLDGIHEDLNRCREKPMVETVTGNGENDRETAKQAWRNHKLRNNSVIVDNFHGQLRSICKCPKCNKTTVVFDPFVAVSLPISQPNVKPADVLFIPYDITQSHRWLHIQVPRVAASADYLSAVRREVGDIPIVVAFVSSAHSFYGCTTRVWFEPGDASFGQQLRPVAFELPPGHEEMRFAMVSLRAMVSGDLPYQTSQELPISELFLVDATDAADDRGLLESIYERIGFAWERAEDPSQEVFKEEEKEESIVEERKEEDRPRVLKSSSSSDEDDLDMPSILKDVHNEIDEDDAFGRKSILSSGSQRPNTSTVTFGGIINKPSSQPGFTIASGAPTQQLHKTRMLSDPDLLPQARKLVEKLQQTKPLHCEEGQLVCIKHSYYSSAFSFEGSKKQPSVHAEPVVVMLNGAELSDEAGFVPSRLLNHYATDGRRRKQGDGGEPVSLEKCFRYFSQEETLDEANQWFCPTCREFVCARKKMDLWRLPRCLVLQLKRFETTETGTEKDERLVEFPDELDLEDFVIGPHGCTKYRLYAVAEHFGGLSGGHCTAHASVCEGRERTWYSFNDSSVTADSRGAHSNAAYVLFYERIDGFDTEVPTGKPRPQGEASFFHQDRHPYFGRQPSGIPPIRRALTPNTDNEQSDRTPIESGDEPVPEPQIDFPQSDTNDPEI